MNKFLIICDRVMYGALLGLIFFLPYSLAWIATFQITMLVAWMAKRFLLWKENATPSFIQSFNIAFRGMAWPLIAIALLIILTVPFSHFPALSLKKFFSRFLQQVFLAYAITEIIHSRKRLYILLSMLLFTFSLVTVDIMAQYTRGKSIVYHTLLTFGRVTGPMNHPNDLGTLLVTVLPVILVAAMIFRKKMPWGPLIALLFLLLSLALGLTSSRGAWVSFGVSMIALGFLLKRPKYVILICAMLAVFFWSFGMYCLGTRMDMYNVSMAHAPAVHPSFVNPWGLPAAYNAPELLLGTSGRESYWKTAIVVIKHSPWFGCGFSAYMRTLQDLGADHEEYPHNSLLHITAELGLVGLVLYIWLFVALCMQVWKVLCTVALERDLHMLACGTTCGILAWLIHSLSDTPWSSLQLGLLLWLLIGLLLSLNFITSDVRSKPCL